MNEKESQFLGVRVHVRVTNKGFIIVFSPNYSALPNLRAYLFRNKRIPAWFFQKLLKYLD